MTLKEQIARHKHDHVQARQGQRSPLLSTINDICTGKSRIENASAGTVYRLAKALGTTADELIAPSFERPAFGIFKGNVCHTLKEQGDIQFIINTLESGEIRKLFSKGWYEESLYLLAMLDYVSRVNHVPLCSEYSDIRSTKLDRVVYSSSVLMLCRMTKSEEPKAKARKEAIRSSCDSILRRLM